ncbi:TonB-dependent receptor domain-containing protein [Jejudonia soesokkakensis]|uniref:TonB-dependent receptor domain-containing protein n=1 Tax=Jejudonia soesokkakensis TaxID=1323432 RepID=A0ABW2MXQ7_9FLAO
MKQIFIALLFVATTQIFAQGQQSQTITVKGAVIEEGVNTPLEYATISFLDTNNNIVTGGITDVNGKYSIEVPAGTYNVQFDFISFKSKTLSNQNLTRDTTLPDVMLALDAGALDEVVVRAETTEVQVRLDKKIYNIGKDLTTSGATVSDALNNVPSVTVDVDGAIALRGNQNVRILINGKPSAIAGFGSTDALRQLPAESIDRVEVITSPSARYDAEGTAGILNIILKKEKTLGLNGSIVVNAGVPITSGVTGNINLRTDKFNIFNTTGIRYNDSPGNAFFENTFFARDDEGNIIPNQVGLISRESRDYQRLNRGFNTNLGIEYYLSENSSITASGFLRLGDDEDTTVNLTNDFDGNNNRIESRNRTEVETEEDTNYQLSVNYTNNFDDSGHVLSADFQFDVSDEIQNNLITENNTFPTQDVLPSEIVRTLEDQTEYLLQADYVRPIGENAQFEAGFRINLEETITDFELQEQFIVNGSFVRNDSLSNVFTYNEDVYAAYTQYGNKFGDFSFLLGLRAENTRLQGNVKAENLDNTTDEALVINFDNNFFGLFPTVNLIYEIAERENITLGYNRRINRPRGFFINPFPSRSSEANVFQGNPNLNPAFSNAFDLGYLKRWDKLTLTSSIYFQRETDSFERIQEDTGEVTSNGIPIIRTIPINLSSNERYGFEAGVLYNPLKWLRLNGSFNYFNFKSEGSFNGIDYGTTNDSWFARGSAKVTLPAKIDWQTNAFYRGPSNNAQTETEGLLSVNLAFSKDIMDDNGTIGLNVSDLFNSRKRMSLTETETFRSESEFQWRERQIQVSFTYRFNQKKQRQRPQRDTGDDEGDFEGS